MRLLSEHEAVTLIGAVLALVGLALAATGTGSPMFVRHATPDGLDGRVRRVGLGAAVLGAAVAALALPAALPERYRPGRVGRISPRPDRRARPTEAGPFAGRVVR